MSRLAFIRVGLCVFACAASSCASTEELPGCYKDTDCAEGRICENHTCTWVDGGSGGGGDDGAGGASCTDTGKSCTVNGDCCSFQRADGFCVSGVCADACQAAEECASGCCALLDSGNQACAPAAHCDPSCAPSGDPCSVNADCCKFASGAGFCVDGLCRDACTEADACATRCCASLEGGSKACAPEWVCQ